MHMPLCRTDQKCCLILVGRLPIPLSINCSTLMSGISRFFAPVKCAGAAADASVVAHASNSTNDAPPTDNDNDKTGKNESIVDGVPIDKDGWQVFPTTVATNTNTNGEAGSVVCIEIDGDDEDFAAGAEKSPAQPPMTAKLEAAPPAESQGVALVEGENSFEPSAEHAISTEVAEVSAEANTAGPTATDAMNPLEISTEASAKASAEANTAGPTATDAMNPFASFAFGSGIATPLVQSKKRPLPTSAASRVVSKNTQESKKANPQQKDAKKRRRSSTKNKCDNDDYVPVRQLPVEQQEEIRAKWQSLGDPNEPLEVRRFQVLVAARLHAQSREPVVRAAMDNLRKYFSEQEGGIEGGTLNAKNLSKADPKEIAKQIPSILFANVKAEHVVKAAKEVCSRFGGNVPQTQHGLKELTGIGPKLAYILAFANSHRAYEKKS